MKNNDIFTIFIVMGEQNYYSENQKCFMHFLLQVITTKANKKKNVTFFSVNAYIFESSL